MKPAAITPPLSSRPSWRDRLQAAWWRSRLPGLLTFSQLLRRESNGNAFACRTRYGTCFLLDPLSYIDGRVIAEGYYESEVLEALRSRLRPTGVLWDIGANFGLHAVTAARLVPDATVVAFEPNPIEHARLLRHRDWNATSLVTSTLALSDTAGILPLHLGPAGNSGMTTLSPWSQATYTGTVLVATATGDELVGRRILPAPTCIKIDVEGHEAAVLRGLAATLADPRCELVVFEDGPDSGSPVKDLLEAAGFDIEPLLRRENTAHGLMNFAARKPAAV